MAQTLMDVFYSLCNCLYCFPGTPQLKINNRSFRMLRLLGEVSLYSAFSSDPSFPLLLPDHNPHSKKEAETTS